MFEVKFSSPETELVNAVEMMQLYLLEKALILQVEELPFLFIMPVVTKEHLTLPQTEREDSECTIIREPGWDWKQRETLGWEIICVFVVIAVRRGVSQEDTASGCV
jgi:hypothetical protein